MRMVVLATVAAMALSGSAAVARDGNASLIGLQNAVAMAPSDAGATIELANAYWRAGRHAEAREAYRRALTLNNEMLETRGGDAVWSRQVARTMLGLEVMQASR